MKESIKDLLKEAIRLEMFFKKRSLKMGLPCGVIYRGRYKSHVRRWNRWQVKRK